VRGRFQLDIRLVGAGLLAAATALVVLMVTAPPERTAIFVAGSDLPAGIPFGELDLVTRKVEDDAGLVTAEAAEALDEHMLSSPLAADAPIPRSLLLAPAGERGVDLLGLDLDSAAAVHGRLAAGDQVDVYAVSQKADLIAEALAVVGIEIDSTSFGPGRVRLLVAVAGEVGPRLLAASEAGTIHLIRRGS